MDRYNLGVLLLRLWFGIPLFLKHGWEKPTNFSQMAQHFPDPLHIGPVPSLIFALVSDAVCSIFIIIGFKTRWAVTLVLINLLVAWSMVHGFKFFGRDADHGELMVLYIGGFAAIWLLGPGKYSVDKR